MGTHPIFESDFDCLTDRSRITKMPLKVDLLNPPLDQQRRCHKKKRLVQSPNSYFMDVKCPGCYKIKHYEITKSRFTTRGISSITRNISMAEWSPATKRIQRKKEIIKI